MELYTNFQAAERGVPLHFGGYPFGRPWAPQKFGFSCKENIKFSLAKCLLETSLRWNSN